jgi:plastocyanin
VIVACSFSGCTSSQPIQTVPPTNTTLVGELNTIVIKNFAFSPANLTIKTGTTVTWLNQDVAVHQIESDSKIPVAFISDSLAHGASFRFTFTQPGNYTYHCIYHPTMKGTIIVQS